VGCRFHLPVNNGCSRSVLPPARKCFFACGTGHMASYYSSYLSAGSCLGTRRAWRGRGRALVDPGERRPSSRRSRPHHPTDCPNLLLTAALAYSTCRSQHTASATARRPRSLMVSFCGLSGGYITKSAIVPFEQTIKDAQGKRGDSNNTECRLTGAGGGARSSSTSTSDIYNISTQRHAQPITSTYDIEVRGRVVQGIRTPTPTLPIFWRARRLW
jgi:hypothetical protein